jgi:acetyl-CoA synthetase
MKFGDQVPADYDLSKLRLLGTVGEPINPEAWMWYHEKVGGERCPIVDTWWQTETGGVLITPLPGAWGTKPGSATLPFFGVNPTVLEPESGTELEGNDVSGVLAIKEPWPGQMRTIYGDHERFEETYFDLYKGFYFSGDGCRRDEDGYYWITGRVDDVINVSGHRMGTAEVESALVSHPKVAEAAVVGFPHPIKGQGIYAYVTLMVGEEYTDDLRSELVKHVRTEIGPIASPDYIHWAPGLPKTRSGKIMRRILRKVAEKDTDSIGDTSTLADPSVVQDLMERDPRVEVG